MYTVSDRRYWGQRQARARSGARVPGCHLTRRFVSGGCDTPIMATLSDSTDTSRRLPLTEAEPETARHDVPTHLGTLPFLPGAASRSLWVVLAGEAGVWTHAVFPVDDRLDRPELEHITHLSTMVGMALSFPLSHARGASEEVLVVLRRPAPPTISEADAFIFRLISAASAARGTAPWRFYVTGPDGARECFRQTANRREAPG